MKIRSLLTVVAMLSILLFSVGMAYAVTGVADDVPGTDVVIPIVCEGHADAASPTGVTFGSLNTLWAIADKSPSAESCSQYPCQTADGHPGVIYAAVNVNNYASETILDTTECWSPNDVISNDCQSILLNANPPLTVSDYQKMEMTVGTTTYLVGYVEYLQNAGLINVGDSPFDCSPSLENRFISWVYLNDAVKGYATGFNGIDLENGDHTGALTEHCNVGSCSGDDVAVTAHDVFPRYFILNNDPDTWTWWMFLLGRDQYPDFGATRILDCFVCDEAENCNSRKKINIPYEMNIIDVNEIVGGSFPKKGFAFCGITETLTFIPFNPTTITGTMSFNDDPPDSDPEFYSLYGWAYQRGITTSLSPNQKLAVVHPVHRTYCMHHSTGTTSVSDDLPNRFEDDDHTAIDCNISGPIPTTNP